MMDEIRIILHLIFFSLFSPSASAPSAKCSISREGSLSSHQLMVTLENLEDVIVKRILVDKGWNTKAKPLKKPYYGNMREFLRAFNLPKDICDHPTHNCYRNKTFYRLFYLLPFSKKSQDYPPFDLNVLRVWTEDENFGEGIRVAIICDNIFAQHPDLVGNYDSIIDYTPLEDENGETNPSTSSPREHVRGTLGTRAAGLIAMSLDSRSCGIGIAPKAKIGAIRVLDEKGKASLVEFTLAMEQYLEMADVSIDIVLNLWKQNYSKFESKDQTYEQLVYRLYERMATQGRQGKGSIHIVPVGKPADSSTLTRYWKNLSCARNLNANSIYTIGVAATEYDGRDNVNSAACAAVMVTAYSTNNHHEYNFIMSTTDADGGCTNHYKNTEAAASLVAGIVALVLKANQGLTYRDVQHLIAWTSETAPISGKLESWRRNKAGFYVSKFWGFGMINVFNMVQTAKTFESVPPLVTCAEPFQLHSFDSGLLTFIMDVDEGYVFDRYVNACRDTEFEINYIEHVTLEVTVRNSTRGTVDISIRSPKGPWVDLLTYEKSNDQPGDQMINWTFDSVMYWGEQPWGRWAVRIRNYAHEKKQDKSPDFPTALNGLTLYLHGTKNAPQHYQGLFSRRYRSYMHPTPYDLLKPPFEKSCADPFC